MNKSAISYTRDPLESPSNFASRRSTSHNQYRVALLRVQRNMPLATRGLPCSPSTTAYRYTHRHKDNALRARGYHYFNGHVRMGMGDPDHDPGTFTDDHIAADDRRPCRNSPGPDLSGLGCFRRIRSRPGRESLLSHSKRRRRDARVVVGSGRADIGGELPDVACYGRRFCGECAVGGASGSGNSCSSCGSFSAGASCCTGASSTSPAARFPAPPH